METTWQDSTDRSEFGGTFTFGSGIERDRFGAPVLDASGQPVSIAPIENYRANAARQTGVRTVTVLDRQWRSKARHHAVEPGLVPDGRLVGLGPAGGVIRSSAGTPEQPGKADWSTSTSHPAVTCRGCWTRMERTRSMSAVESSTRPLVRASRSQRDGGMASGRGNSSCRVPGCSRRFRQQATQQSPSSRASSRSRMRCGCRTRSV